MDSSSVGRARSDGARIDEEAVSVDSLKHVLFTRYGCKAVHIHREEHDPPDFTLTVDGEAFPAEVTSIVSRQRYVAQCKEFARAIRNHADSFKILSGTYAFQVSRFPDIPKPRSRSCLKVIDTYHVLHSVAHSGGLLPPRDITSPSVSASACTFREPVVG